MKSVSLWIFVGLILNSLLLLPTTSFTQGGQWKEKADMPTARYGLATGVVNGTIYAFGGIGRLPLSVVEAYDPLTNRWTQRADMPKLKGYISASAVDDKIYVFQSSNSPVLEYDPVTNQWTEKSKMPTTRYTAFSTIAVEGKIYVMGGLGIQKRLEPTVEAYEPATDTWTLKAPMPTPKADFAISAVNGKIYTFGGGPVLSAVDVYDPTTDTWTKKANMPTGRYAASATAVNGKIYVLGGRKGDVPHSTLEVYDPMTDAWGQPVEMPTARDSLSTSAVYGRIYAIGGKQAHDTNPLSTVEEYDAKETSQGVEAKEKLTTTWGRIKQTFNAHFVR